jgi:hypothetical protein
LLYIERCESASFVIDHIIDQWLLDPRPESPSSTQPQATTIILQDGSLSSTCSPGMMSDIDTVPNGLGIKHRACWHILLESSSRVVDTKLGSGLLRSKSQDLILGESHKAAVAPLNRSSLPGIRPKDGWEAAKAQETEEGGTTLCYCSKC